MVPRTGDSMKKVRPGDPLVVPAQAYNAFIDAAQDFRNRTSNRGRSAAPTNTTTPWTGVVLVRNDSGSDVDRFGILGIDDVLITPSDNDAEFYRRVAFSGVTPSLPSHLPDRFVITLEPIKDGEIGRAVVNGVVPCTVNVTSGTPTTPTTPTTATLIDGESGKLTEGGMGCDILWIDEGVGDVRALVRVGRNQPCVVKIKSLDHDTITVETVGSDGNNHSGDEFLVAKPGKLRHDANQYPGVTSVTTVDANTMIVQEGEPEEERWVVTPAYAIGDYLLIAKVNHTGLDDGGDPAEALHFVDLNLDARAWAQEYA